MCDRCKIFMHIWHWIHSPARLCCPKVASELSEHSCPWKIVIGQHCSMPHSQEKLHLHTESLSVLSFLCPVSSTPSAGELSGPPGPGHSLVTNYQILRGYNLNFPFTRCYIFQETNHDGLNYIANISLYIWKVQERTREEKKRRQDANILDSFLQVINVVIFCSEGMDL